LTDSKPDRVDSEHTSSPQDALDLPGIGRPRQSSQTRTRSAEPERSRLAEFLFPRLPAIDSRSYTTIPSLDGLRAVSILLVILAHCGLGRVGHGAVGVTIFFLSGYLITTLLRREFAKTGRVDLRRFYIRRCLRILPPCYVVIAVVLLLELAIGEGISGGAVLAHVFYYTNYYQIYISGGGLKGLGVLWSLAVEEHFYLVFPLLYLATVRFSRRHQGSILAAICLVVLAWRWILTVHFQHACWRIYSATDTRLDSILWGCCFAIVANPAFDDRLSNLFSHWASSAIALAALGFSLVCREPWFRESFVYTIQSLAPMPVFALAIRSHHRWPFRFLNWYPMRLIGVYSYTIYLTHLAVVRFLGLGRPGQFAITFPIVMTGSFLLSAMMYYYVDQPCAALRKRYAS
jgi:peptidoglycan/LPS O-acetylase OafA/YrhL